MYVNVLPFTVSITVAFTRYFFDVVTLNENDFVNVLLLVTVAVTAETEAFLYVFESFSATWSRMVAFIEDGTVDEITCNVPVPKESDCLLKLKALVVII